MNIRYIAAAMTPSTAGAREDPPVLPSKRQTRKERRAVRSGIALRACGKCEVDTRAASEEVDPVRLCSSPQAGCEVDTRAASEDVDPVRLCASRPYDPSQPHTPMENKLMCDVSQLHAPVKDGVLCSGPRRAARAHARVRTTGRPIG